MPDLNKMPPAELAAAMRGGTEGWGEVGSAQRNIRYAVQKPARRGRRRKCHCGCDGPATHAGMANGLCLMSGCELTVHRWVRDGR